MRAAVYSKYGPPEVVHLAERPRPSPGQGELLVRVVASTITAADWRARSLTLPPGFGVLGRVAFGFFGPRKPVLGMEFSGEVEGVGEGVTAFKPGDRVFGSTGMRMGCHAEYLTVRQDSAVVPIPPGLSFDVAASLAFGGSTALHFLKQGANLQPGEKVLIVGASGSVGSACVQLAKHFGAEVTGVCSAANLELVRGIGADHVIDYQSEDFTRNGKTYDIIVDAAGTTTFDGCKGSLNEGGRLLLVLSGLGAMLKAPFQSKAGGKRVYAGTAFETAEDLKVLAGLASQGAYKPLVDRTYPLDDIVQAHAYVDTGRKKGNVVIHVAAAAQA